MEIFEQLEMKSIVLDVSIVLQNLTVSFDNEIVLPLTIATKTMVENGFTWKDVVARIILKQNKCFLSHTTK